MSTEDLNLRMKLTGSRVAAAGVTKVSDSVEKLGRRSKLTGEQQATASAKSRVFGRRIDDSGNSAKRAIGQFKTLALTVGGTALAYASVHGIERSIDRTIELTGAAKNLTRVYGFSQKAASEYAIVADTLGVDQKSFATGMTFLSRNVVAAVGQQGKLADQQAKSRRKVMDLRTEIGKLGNTEKDRTKRLKLQQRVEAEQAKGAELATGKQLAAFKALGISQKTLRSGDTNKIFEETVEALNKMPGGPQKAALQMQIFGRGAAKLAPILAQGSKGLEEWRKKSRDAAKQLNPELLKKYREEQRESKLMWTELSVTIGTKMLPKIMRLEHGMLDAMKAWKEGRGTMGDVKGMLEGVASAAGKVFDFFTKNPKVLKALTIGILGVAGAVKVFGITTALLEAPLTMAIAEMLGLDAAMDANPIGLIVVAIAGLAAGLVVAYKKVGWFHHAVNAVWGFLKKHWVLVGTLILGPIVPAIRTVVKHWDTIHGAINRIIVFVKDHWRAMVIGLAGPFAPVVALIVTQFDKVKGAFRAVIDFITGAWNHFAGVINKGIGVANKLPHVNLPTVPTIGGDGGGSAAGSRAANQKATNAFVDQQLGRVPTRTQARVQPGTLSAKFTASSGGGSVYHGPEKIELHVSGRKLAEVTRHEGKWQAARA